MNTKQLRPEEVAAKLGISIATFYRFVATEGCDFPKPIRYTARWTAYFETEVDMWIINNAAKQRNIQPEELIQTLSSLDALASVPVELTKSEKQATEQLGVA